MNAAAWTCLLLPLASTVAITAAGTRISRRAAAYVSTATTFGSPESIGRLFLTDHLLAFEVTSIVLLVAAVGGVVLGAHARAVEDDARA